MGKKQIEQFTKLPDEVKDQAIEDYFSALGRAYDVRADAPCGSVCAEICDITKLEVDAVVNAANYFLMGGGGVDGAIHKAAGRRRLNAACREKLERMGVQGCGTGQVVLTDGFRLPAKHIIHTVGPIYADHTPQESAKLLRMCYENCMNLAWEQGFHSIAFPAVSTGIYGYPVEEACWIAYTEVMDWMESFRKHHYDMKVIFSCYTEDVYREFKKLFAEGMGKED
jgi:O-acetyl-ADP-ribose deacetylase (regulator of RNase III)